MGHTYSTTWTRFSAISQGEVESGIESAAASLPVQSQVSALPRAEGVSSLLAICGRCLVVASLLATIGSTLRVYPHQLAYFNEIAGGAEGGHKHFLGSNLDWGQDLLYLREYLSSIPHVRLLGVKYDTAYAVRDILPLIDALCCVESSCSAGGVAVLLVSVSARCSPLRGGILDFGLHSISDANLCDARIGSGALLLVPFQAKDCEMAGDVDH